MSYETHEAPEAHDGKDGYAPPHHKCPHCGKPIHIGMSRPERDSEVEPDEGIGWEDSFRHSMSPRNDEQPD